MLYGFLLKAGACGYAAGVLVVVAVGDATTIINTFLNTFAANIAAITAMIMVLGKLYFKIIVLEKKVDQNTEITKRGAEAAVQATEENKGEIAKVIQKVTNVRKAQATGLLVASDKQVDLTVQVKQLEAERDAARTEAAIKASEAERIAVGAEAKEQKHQELTAGYLKRIAEQDAMIEQSKKVASAIEIITEEPRLRVEPQD